MGVFVLRRETKSEPAIGAREAEVLRAVVEAHGASGRPVGSGTVARQSRLGLSAASIRATMSELEERGLLAQPHTSAGRIPTDTAYRLYVDRLMPTPRVDADRARRIERALADSQGELGTLLGEASRLLSRHSRQVGVVLAPDLRRVVVEHFEFVRLGPRRVMAILIGRSGALHHRTVRIEGDIDQDRLDRMGRYLSDRFGGRTVRRIRRELIRAISETRSACDELVARSFDLAHRAFDESESRGDVFVDGTSNLLAAPDFHDLDEVRCLLRALEEKRRLVELLGRLLESDGVQVMIGEENPVSALARCSLVASTYRSRSRVLGTVGIVGPTRMEYGNTIALVEHLAGTLSDLLSSPAGGNEEPQ